MANADSLIQHQHQIGVHRLETAIKPEYPVTAGENDDGTLRPAQLFAAESDARPYYSTQCDVDFNDEDALALSEPSLWADRIYVPWFQRCGSYHVDIRTTRYSHFHLGFEDPDVEYCFDNDQAYPSRIDENGACEFVHIPTEPRSYASTHYGDEWLRIRYYNGDQFLPFALERIRIVGNAAVRLCYKKSQDSDPGEWLTSQNASAGPSVWQCWNALEPSYWDVSDWAWDIVEARITAEDGTSSFSIDDLRIGN